MLKLTSPVYLLPCLAIAILAAGKLPAAAQGVEQPVYVRVTTGSTQFRGWEQTLIQGNANLGHFTWIPVTGYTQGYQKVVQRKGPDVVKVVPGSPRAPIYIKPIAVPAGYYAGRPHTAQAGSGNSPGQSRTAIQAAARLPGAQEDLFGKLARQRASLAVAARLKENTVAVYPPCNSSYYGAGQGATSTTSTAVHGLLKYAFRDR